MDHRLVFNGALNECDMKFPTVQTDGLMTLIRVASELRDCILALVEVFQDHRLEHTYPAAPNTADNAMKSADTPAVIILIMSKRCWVTFTGERQHPVPMR